MEMWRPIVTDPTPISLIAFDADDTLWHNEYLYTQAKDQFCELLAPFGSAEQVHQRLDIVEENNVLHYGYGIKSFTLSMVETAMVISDGCIAVESLQFILQMGKDMLATELPFLDYAENTLAELSQEYPLMLITKGDTFEQQRKIERSGLAKYFRFIEIVANKTPATYQRLFKQHAIEPRQVLMVGNSLRSDILPVLEIGGQAVYIHYESTWSHEYVDETARARYHYFEIDHLGELAALVATLNQTF
jgi:putative hydrolase of the HAD superfamily